MATIPAIKKQPLKVLEVPLNKFSEEVIPHYQKILEIYKPNIQKLIAANDANELNREVRNKKKTIRQLKDLLYELDTLRAQVEDVDLDVFDTKTLSLRRQILGLVSEYQELEKAATKVVTAHQETIENAEKPDPFSAASQLQVHENIEDVKLKQLKEVRNEVETIQENVQDLHEMYAQLHQMVGEQAENVENIENNIDQTQENVDRGLKQLVKAHKLKTVTFPLTGAVVGTCVGGPIGMLAGLKVGLAASVGCGVVGYGFGKIMKKFHFKQTEETERNLASNEENAGQNVDKKDI